MAFLSLQRIFLSFIPIGAFILLFLYFLQYRDEAIYGYRSIRRSFLSAAILWAFFLTLLTEILNFFNSITLFAVIAAWSIFLTFTAFLFFRSATVTPRQFLRASLNLSKSELIQLSGVLLIALATLVIAVVAPPNNNDSMIYHMSRVWHWTQNHSLTHYRAVVQFQNYLSPGAEMIILHFQILTGGDCLANTVQWFSMVGSLIGVSLIAKALGARRSGQIFSSVFAATIPMGILQASSTQNDYAAAFWLVCFVYFLISTKKSPGIANVFFTGASLGLAILTKATALIFAFPFSAWIGLALLKSNSRSAFKFAGIILALILVFNFGHFYRNVMDFGHPLAPQHYRNANANQETSLRVLSSNIIRNCALHLATPCDKFNRLLEDKIHSLHTLIGIDVNCPDTTFGRVPIPFHILFSTHEDMAGNPIHFLIIFGCVIFLIFTFKAQSSDLIRYQLSLIAAFAFFCIYIKWNPWNSRYHLSLFVLQAPIAGAIFTRAKSDLLSKSLSLVLIVASLPWIFFNYTRPLLSCHSHFESEYVSGLFKPSESIFSIPRWKQYFANNPWLADPYFQGVQQIAAMGCHDVALSWSPIDEEYAFLILMQSMNHREMIIQTITLNKALSVRENAEIISPEYRPYTIFTFSDPGDQSARYRPCAVYTSDIEDIEQNIMSNARYRLSWLMGSSGIWLSDE